MLSHHNTAIWLLLFDHSPSNTFHFRLVEIRSFWTFALASFRIELMTRQAFLFRAHTMTCVVVEFHWWFAQSWFTTVTATSWYWVQRVGWAVWITITCFPVMVVSIISICLSSMPFQYFLINITFVSIRKKKRVYELYYNYKAQSSLFLVVWFMRRRGVFRFLRPFPETVTEICTSLVRTRVFMYTFSIALNVVALSALAIHISFKGNLLISYSHPSKNKKRKSFINNINHVEVILYYHLYPYCLNTMTQTLFFTVLVDIHFGFLHPVNLSHVPLYTGGQCHSYGSLCKIYFGPSAHTGLKLGPLTGGCG